MDDLEINESDLEVVTSAAILLASILGDKTLNDALKNIAGILVNAHESNQNVKIVLTPNEPVSATSQMLVMMTEHILGR